MTRALALSMPGIPEPSPRLSIAYADDLACACTDARRRRWYLQLPQPPPGGAGLQPLASGRSAATSARYFAAVPGIEARRWSAH